MARLEHANVTVRDADATAALLSTLFDWSVRWQGEAIHGGRTVHVGERSTYLALYTREVPQSDTVRSYDRQNGLNHLGIVVDDLEEAERRVIAAGFEPINHADYEPGRRFYFLDSDGLEFEIIAY